MAAKQPWTDEAIRTEGGRREGQYGRAGAECAALEPGDHPSSPQQGVGDERTTQAPGGLVTFV